MAIPQQLPSKQWSILKYRGEEFAQVWFKPEGDPLAVLFRISQASFRLPGLDQHLTMENLLKAVRISADEVESWSIGKDGHATSGPSDPAFAQPLARPVHENYLEITVRLREPVERSQTSEAAHQEPTAVEQNNAVGFSASPSPAVPAAGIWHELEARWKAVLGLEATIDTFRISLEGLLAELQAAFRRPLSMEEKTYALRADIAQWERAKNRVHFATPKMKEFIHRATWALGSPERKRLGELYKERIQPQIPFPDMDQALRQIEDLVKDRQVLASIGKSVFQECKSIAADIQNSLRAVQSSAVTQKTKAASAARGRFFK